MPVSTALQRLAPESFLAAHSFLLARGDRLSLTDMRRRLEQAGYQCVPQVMTHGEFAVRGSLLDLFPMGSPVPYRVDLFDEEIETIRSFDPESQRTLEKVHRIELLPAREFPLDEAGIAHFRGAFRNSFEGNPGSSLIYQEVSSGNAPGGLEYYLPLFFDQTATLFDYLPAQFLGIHVGRLWKAYFILPYPNQRGLWVNFKSPLLWDVFAVSTYASVSALFWYVGLIPDLATLRDRSKSWFGKRIYGAFALGWRTGPAITALRAGAAELRDDPVLAAVVDGLVAE